MRGANLSLILAPLPGNFPPAFGGQYGKLKPLKVSPPASVYQLEKVYG